MDANVLLTGATGYIGGRLLRSLEEGGHAVRCLARRPESVPATRATTEVVRGDCLDESSLDDAFAGVHTAYYLVHSMAAGPNFAELDRRAAGNFGRAAARAGVRRIIYLGGLGDDIGSLSTHLRSRAETGEALRAAGVPVIEFRASIVIGAGSLSFEMIRSLVERLPLMVCPRWVDTLTQPIAVDDVVAYLAAALDLPGSGSKLFEIGGPEVVSYGDIMREYARVRGLRRLLLMVPMLTPHLSGLWLALVTPAQARVGRALVEGLRNPTVVRSAAAREAFAIDPMPLGKAVAKAERGDFIPGPEVLQDVAAPAPRRRMTAGLRRLVLALGAALLAAMPLAAQDTAGVGTIRGQLIDASGARAQDVAVCVPETGQCAVSDADGRFVISVRPGSYALEILPSGSPMVVSDNVEVRAGLDSVVEIALPALQGVQQTVTVTAPSFSAPEEVKTSGYLVAPQDIAASAGALQDVSRHVQSLPGVVIGTDDFRNDLIVRGGSPLENLYIVDNIEIPNINSFATFASAGGTVSILDVQLIDSVTFLTGGYPAPFGNRTSSVLQIAQREGRRDRVGGRATLGFAGAGAVVEGPIGAAKRGSWIVSARRSFLDLFTDDTGIGGVPVLYTLNGKVVYDASPRDRIWAVNLSGVDTIRLGLTDDSDLSEELSNLDIQYDGWRSATGVNWQRVYSRGVGLLGMTHSRASVSQQVTDLLRNGLPAPGASVADQIAGGKVVFRERSSEAETTIKYDFTASVPFLQKLQAGGSLKASRIDYDAASPFGTDSPFFAVASANPFVARERFTAFQGGAYVQATRPLTERLTVTGGARLDRYEFISATRVSPRLGADYVLTPRLTLRASYGQYYQQPFFLFLTAYPENRALAPFRADHQVGGLTLDFDAVTRLTVEAYRKSYRDYPVSSQIPSLSLANVGDTFALRDILFPMISTGRGAVTGLEAHIERKAQAASRWHGASNIALSRGRYAGRDAVLRPGSFDYPVVSNITGSFRMSPAWTLSAKMAYLDGRPFTPLDPVLSAAQRRAVYDVSRVNAGRSPDYFRLDVRVDRRFGRGDRRPSIFAGVQNVTNRRNFAGYRWDRRNNVLETSEQLGVFPIVGLEWPF